MRWGSSSLRINIPGSGIPGNKKNGRRRWDDSRCHVFLPGSEWALGRPETWKIGRRIDKEGLVMKVAKVLKSVILVICVLGLLSLNASPAFPQTSVR